MQSPGRSGHTLVEVIVACVVFTAGILTTQAAALAVIRQASEARTRQIAIEAAAANVERLINEPCDGVWNGSAIVRGVRLAWFSAGALGAHARFLTQSARFTIGSRQVTDSQTVAVPCR